MRVRPLLPRHFGWIALGVAVGLCGLLPMRAAYYSQFGFGGEMAPQIAYLFGPLIFGLLVAVAFIAEMLVQWRFSRPASRAQAFLIGVAYVSLLLWWAFPGFGWVILVVNPFTLRWLINRLSGGEPNAA